MNNLDIISNIVAIAILCLLWVKLYQKALFSYAKTRLLKVETEVAIYFKNKNISEDNNAFEMLTAFSRHTQKSVEKYTLSYFIKSHLNMNEKIKYDIEEIEREILHEQDEETCIFYKEKINEMCKVIVDVTIKRNPVLLMAYIISSYVFLPCLIICCHVHNKIKPQKESFHKVKDDIEDSVLPKAKQLALLETV